MQITIEVPDRLGEQLQQLGDREASPPVQSFQRQRSRFDSTIIISKVPRYLWQYPSVRYSSHSV